MNINATQPPILKNDVAANVGGVQSSNGNKHPAKRSSSGKSRMLYKFLKRMINP